MGINEYMLNVPVSFKLFICSNNPKKSFILRLTQEQLINFTLRDLFDLAFSHFQKLFQNYEILKNSLRNYFTRYQNVDKQFINTSFYLTPIYFDEIESINNQVQVQAVKSDEIFLELFVSKQYKQFNLIVKQSETTQEVFERIFKYVEGILTPNDVRLVPGGQRIVISNEKISDYIFKNFAKITVFTESQGSGEGLFINLENEQSVTIINFSSNAPEYRIATNGLNLEGYCQNKRCKYYQKLAISQIGYGAVEIINELYDKVKCPGKQCNVPIKLETCGFTNCTYEWNGYQRIDGKNKHIKSKILSIKGYQYKRHNPNNQDGTINKVKWIQLYIFAKPLISYPECFICLKIIISQQDRKSIQSCQNNNNHICHQECSEKMIILQKQCFLCIKSIF